jgi:hypothetical protein
VAVWREARRLKGEQQGLVENLRQAADEPDWTAFVRAMGGPIGKRDEWPVRIARLEWWMTDTGELDASRHGEPADLKPFGLEHRGTKIPTRRLWEIIRRHEPADGEPQLTAAGSVSPWSSVNNCAEPGRLGPSPKSTSAKEPAFHPRDADPKVAH